MAVPARHPLMTAEQLFELPDDGYRSELVEGEIVRMTPTSAEHGVLSIRIGRLLDEHVSARELGVCCGAETGFILRRDPDVVRAPDAAFVAAARIPATGIPKTYWPFAPDLAVEVVSPSDRLTDIHIKIAEYFAAGTRLVWIVEPSTEAVHAYRSPHDVRVLRGDDELSGEDVLPGFRCVVKRLFCVSGLVHGDGETTSCDREER